MINRSSSAWMQPVALLATGALLLAACGDDSGEDTSERTTGTTVLTEPAREVLLAEAACALAEPTDAEVAFAGTVVELNDRPGECSFTLEPGLSGADSMVVDVELYTGTPPDTAREVFERGPELTEVERVAGIGEDAYYSPTISTVNVLVAPTGETLPARGAELGAVAEVILVVQVLLPGVGEPAPENQDEIRDGLVQLAEALTARI